LVAVPFTWLAPFALAPIVSMRRRTVPAPRALGFVIAAGLCLASVSGFAELGLYMATMRYLADVTNGLVLLGALGGFSLWSLREGLLRRGAAALVALLGVATLVTGLLLGFQGYTRHFARMNPPVQDRLERSLSFCPPRPPAPPKPARRNEPAKPTREKPRPTKS
jgi:4-amino-4-deoxy-L-arabinose transferase-like glycosyltransferase